MNKEEAIYFAGLMGFYLNIPSFVCENIEKKLIDENYKEVIEFIINRAKELKEKQKDIKHQMEMIYKENNKYKEVLDKIKEYIKENNHQEPWKSVQGDYILELLEEIE